MEGGMKSEEDKLRRGAEYRVEYLYKFRNRTHTKKVYLTESRVWEITDKNLLEFYIVW